MRREIRIALVLFIGGMPLSAAPAEPDAETRAAAKLIASVEQPLVKRDLKGYCAAVYSTPDHAKYVASSCQAGVKNNARKPEDCSDANNKQTIAKIIAGCIAMTPEKFGATIKLWDEVRQKFLAEMTAKGIDGEKVLKEERAKLR
jgi:hypothetical protein